MLSPFKSSIDFYDQSPLTVDNIFHSITPEDTTGTFSILESRKLSGTDDHAHGNILPTATVSNNFPSNSRGTITK
jgi:hypothetical protein